MSPYPILAERALRPAQRRFLRGARRDPGELPVPEPGSVLVFEVSGGYRAFTERRHLMGAEDEVANAVSVSVVDVRTRSVPVSLAIPSSDLAHEFPLEATFTCAVIHPEKVVEHHVNAVEELARHLMDNADLLSAGLRHPIEEIHLLRPKLAAMVKAYVEIIPPDVPGLKVKLAAVDVRMPDDVRGHAMELKTIRRRGQALELAAAIENQDVDRLVTILTQGSTATTALGLSRGHVHVGEALAMQREDEEHRKKELIDMIKSLPAGALDFVPVDVRVYIQEHARLTVGTEAADRLFSTAAPVGDWPSPGELDRPRPLDIEDDDD
ncbi:hypothetical protein [Nonomuraea indica]|uniref:hypothetical protein n=1 Tax=Nonomuraea indica TaxID=1581193 RepID=UPI001183315F|nr:hypothetical protein [Nonomuraea indica]